MRRLLLLVVLLVLPTPSFAQVGVVQQAIADLRNAHANLSGECGAFKVVQLVAWRLRTSGAGYYRKGEVGAHCQGFSTDIVTFTNGQSFDILYDAGGLNDPTWNALAPNTDPSKYQAPADPGDPGTPTPTPVPPPVGGVVTPDVIRAIVSSEVDKVYAQNERIFASVSDNIMAILGKEDALRDQLKAHDEKTNKILAFFGDGKTITAIVSAISTWFALKAKN